MPERNHHTQADAPRLQERIDREVAKAPIPSPELKDRLAYLLRGGAGNA